MTEIKIETGLLLIRLSHHLPRQSRSVRAVSDVDAARLRASAKLYSGGAFEAIKSHDRGTSAELLKYAIRIPAMMDGVYVLPIGLSDEVDTLLRRRSAERDALIERFLEEDYDREREEARKALNGSFREEDFPPSDIIRDHFVVKWNVFCLRMPDGLPPGVQEEETAKFRRNMEEAYLQCRDALRIMLRDLVGHLADKLTQEEGKKKRLYASTVDNLREFLDTIDRRDVTSDDDIRALCNKARTILGDATAEDLKGGTFVGQQVSDGMQDIKNAIEELIVTDQKRKIDLDI